MSEPILKKFDFDTVFDDAGAVAQVSARPKRIYPLEEVEVIRAQAYAEGERAAMARLEAQQADALSTIAQACQAALPRLAEVAHAHRIGSAELALACGQAIADAALDAFPRAPLKAALDSLAREIESAPRLLVTVSPTLAEGLEPMLAEAAQAFGAAADRDPAYAHASLRRSLVGLFQGEEYEAWRAYAAMHLWQTPLPPKGSS